MANCPGVVATTDLQEAFTNINYAILVGAMPRKEGMERKDLLKANCGIFKVQGKALNDYANKDVKVRFVSFLFKKALEQDDSRTPKWVSPQLTFYRRCHNRFWSSATLPTPTH